MNGATLFRWLTLFAALEMVPLALVTEGTSVSGMLAALTSSQQQTLLLHTLISSVCFYMYNEVSFWILDIVHPVSHAVGNTIRRVILIVVSAAVLQAPLSGPTMLGSFVAILGTLLFSLSQQ